MRAWFIPAWTLAALLAGALSAHAQIAPREPPLQGPKGARDCIEMVAPAAPEDDPKIKAGRPTRGRGSSDQSD